MSFSTAKDRLSSLVDEQLKAMSSMGYTLTQQQITDLKRVTGEWLDSTQYKTISLSANKPDFNQILLQFQNALEHEDAWKDILTAGAGQSILRFFAASAAQGVYAQERSTQEQFSYIARLDSSIYAASRSYGVRIDRRIPAQVSVQLSREGSGYLLIEPFTTFVVGSVKFFNRDPIVFSQGAIFPVTAVLHQGEVFTDTYNSPGVPFAAYEIGNGSANISDEDVYLYVNDFQYTRILTGFDLYGPNDTVFYENTLPNGNVEVITGSGNYGVMPSASTVVRIRYVTTMGVEAHNATVELLVLCPTIDIVSGKSLTPVEGGAVPNSPEFYRLNSPFVRASGDRSVIRRDYTLAALRYKALTIRDARVIGQKEIAPDKKWAQGVIKLCAISDTIMSDKDWQLLIAYMDSKGMEGMTILRENPIPVPIDIIIDLGVTQDRALEAVKQAATAAVTNGYAPKQGSLGNDFFRGDIQTIIKESNDPVLKGGINWMEVTTPNIPTQRLELQWNQYITINSLVINTEYSDRTYSNRLGESVN